MSEMLPAFEALSANEQQILAVLALVGQPLNRTNWAELLQQLQVLDTHKRAFGPTGLRAHIAAWEKQGLVELAGRGESYRIATELLHPWLAQLAAHGAIAPLAQRLRSVAPLHSRYGSLNIGAAPRELLLHLYLGPSQLDLSDLLRQASSYTGRDTGQLLLEVLGVYAPAARLQALGLPLAESYLQRLFETSVLTLTRAGEGALQLMRDARGLLGAEALAMAAAYLALRGEQDAALLLLERPEPPLFAARCLVALTRGRCDEARSAAVSAIEGTRAKKSLKLKGLKSWLGAWVTLALLTDHDPRSVALARAQLESIKRPHHTCETLHALLEQLSQLLLLGEHSRVRLKNYAYRDYRWDELLFLRSLAQAAGEKLPSELVQQAEHDAGMAREHDFGWIAAELAAHNQHEGLGLLVRREEPWQRALRALEATIDAVHLDTPPAAAPRAASERLVWTLTPQPDGGHHVTARVQTARVTGWSAGRQLTWKKLAESSDASWFSPEDLPLLKHIQPPDPRHYRFSHTPDGELPRALIGHPRVFLDPECKQPVQVVRGTVRLQVKTRGDELVITLAPQACHAREVVCELDGQARVLVYGLSMSQLQIAERLGKTGLGLPAQARPAPPRSGRSRGWSPTFPSTRRSASRASRWRSGPRTRAFTST